MDRQISPDKNIPVQKHTRRAVLRGFSGGVAGGLAAYAVKKGLAPGAASAEGNQPKDSPHRIVLQQVSKDSGDVVSEKPLAKYYFGEDVSENLRTEIQDGVKSAVTWVKDKTGVNLEGVSVFAYGDSNKLSEAYFARKGGDFRTLEQIKADLARATAFAGQQKDFYVLTTSPGWTSASPIVGGPIKEGRLHTIFHELGHVMQREVHGYDQYPIQWLNEGFGHYVAGRALEDNGIYSYADIRQRHLPEAGKVTQQLASLEGEDFFRAGGPAADEYSLAFLAVESLVAGLPENGLPALVSYWRGIGDGKGADVAFQGAFGRSKSQFYADFEAYRARGFR